VGTTASLDAMVKRKIPANAHVNKWTRHSAHSLSPYSSSYHKEIIFLSDNFPKFVDALNMPKAFGVIVYKLINKFWRGEKKPLQDTKITDFIILLMTSLKI